MLAGAKKALLEPRDAASLAVFRFLFGAVLCLSSIRFLWNGWVDRFYVQPTFFFKYLPSPQKSSSSISSLQKGEQKQKGTNEEDDSSAPEPRDPSTRAAYSESKQW